MTTEEIKKDDSTSVQSSEIVDALLKATQANTESIATLVKSIDELKKTDANPVAHGSETSEKPKVSDSSDAGTKAKTDPSYAPDGDAQGGNSGKSDKPKSDSTDDAGTGSVKKADEDEPKEGKEVKKMEEKDEDKKEDYPMKKSVSPSGDIEYSDIAKSRPLHKAMPDTPEGAPTGSQVLDQINKGWGGKHTSYEQSFIEALNRLEKGEFGSGNPGGNF